MLIGDHKTGVCIITLLFLSEHVYTFTQICKFSTVGCCRFYILIRLYMHAYIVTELINFLFTPKCIMFKFPHA